MICCFRQRSVALSAMVLAIEATRARVFPSLMATESRSFTAADQARTLGDAIRALRERVDMTQSEAAKAIGVTRQAWQNYEAGARQAILRSDLQDQIARALGVNRADLVRERDRRLGLPGMAEAAPEPMKGGFAYELAVLGRVRASPIGPQIYDADQLEQMIDVSWMFGPSARTLRVAGDSMTGYVESGDLVIYDLSQWPRRGEGCVVELQNGDIYVKEYAGTAQGVLKVRQRFPEEELSFPMDQVKGVYTVRFRGG